MIKKILKTIILFIVILSSLFLFYTADYYKADNKAKTILETNRNIEFKDNYTLLKPSDNNNNNNNTAIIFYPGAKVEYSAYLPLLTKLSEKGYTVINMEMPFYMAIFNKNAADEIIGKLNNINSYYIAGHSMGGAMASSYASANKDKISGLILLGAYIYGDYPPSKTLTIYGSLNTSIEKKLTYNDNIVKIDGGNHAAFGNYGHQYGDAPATISDEKQQDEAIKAINNFIENGKI